MNDVQDTAGSSGRDHSWSTRSLVVATVATVALGVGAGTALGVAADASDSGGPGRGGPGQMQRQPPGGGPGVGQFRGQVPGQGGSAQVPGAPAQQQPSPDTGTDMAT